MLFVAAAAGWASHFLQRRPGAKKFNPQLALPLHPTTTTRIARNNQQFLHRLSLSPSAPLPSSLPTLFSSQALCSPRETPQSTPRPPPPAVVCACLLKVSFRTKRVTAIHPLIVYLLQHFRHLSPRSQRLSPSPANSLGSSKQLSILTSFPRSNHNPQCLPKERPTLLSPRTHLM